MQIFGGMFSKSLGRITINSITSNIINKELLLLIMQLYYYSLLLIKPKILQRIIVRFSESLVHRPVFPAFWETGVLNLQSLEDLQAVKIDVVDSL